MKTRKYTIADLNEQFPTDDACLEFLFAKRFPNGGTCKCGKSGCFHRVSGMKKFACAWCGKQLSPTAGTIFHKSSTPLRSWFHDIFLMTASRNGVSAMELMRQVGVCYETAWRMNHQIRLLMAGDGDLMKGVVEADETYIGGKRPGPHGRGQKHKAAVAGLLERGGNVDATVVPDCKADTLMPNVAAKVAPGTAIHTDEWLSYTRLAKMGFKHSTVNHGEKQYVDGSVHTNGVESFWAQLKRSIGGTFHHVSRKHLQAYLDEFSFRHNQRHEAEPMFESVLAKAAALTSPAA